LRLHCRIVEEIAPEVGDRFLISSSVSRRPKPGRVETETAPIRYVAEFIGADADSEKAIRWLITLMVQCCDPLPIALTAAASAGLANPLH
jgi:hypothetical protein